MQILGKVSLHFDLYNQVIRFNLHCSYVLRRASVLNLVKFSDGPECATMNTL